MYAGSVIESGVTADVIHHPGIRIPLVCCNAHRNMEYRAAITRYSGDGTKPHPFA